MNMPGNLRLRNTPAVTLTTAFTAPIAINCIVDYIAFFNRDTVDRLVTITDGNGFVLYAQPAGAPAGQLTTIPLPEGGLYFAGGVQWKADANSKVDAWIRLFQF